MYLDLRGLVKGYVPKRKELRHRGSAVSEQGESSDL